MHWIPFDAVSSSSRYILRSIDKEDAQGFTLESTSPLKVERMIHIDSLNRLGYQSLVSQKTSILECNPFSFSSTPVVKSELGPGP